MKLKCLNLGFLGRDISLGTGTYMRLSRDFQSRLDGITSSKSLIADSFRSAAPSEYCNYMQAELRRDGLAYAEVVPIFATAAVAPPDRRPPGALLDRQFSLYTR
jgi:hypothetical protein